MEEICIQREKVTLLPTRSSLSKRIWGFPKIGGEIIRQSLTRLYMWEALKIEHAWKIIMCIGEHQNHFLVVIWTSGRKSKVCYAYNKIPYFSCRRESSATKPWGERSKYIFSSKSEHLFIRGHHRRVESHYLDSGFTLFWQCNV